MQAVEGNKNGRLDKYDMEGGQLLVNYGALRCHACLLWEKRRRTGSKHAQAETMLFSDGVRTCPVTSAASLTEPSWTNAPWTRFFRFISFPFRLLPTLVGVITPAQIFAGCSLGCIGIFVVTKSPILCMIKLGLPAAGTVYINEAQTNRGQARSTRRFLIISRTVISTKIPTQAVA
ncbi:hypothetical protein K438DRAFT_1752001 [Mycena galopus ATCC 62051]|nr:hypothetical protein K438DRAFT_1752001 [Mycena galopus ATCC 62051]